MDYLKWLEMSKQQGNNVAGMPQLQLPDTGNVVPMGQAAGDPDAALQAILAIEALSPQQKKMQRQRAQAQQLRDFALTPSAKHWTGALAQGLAGGLSGYQDRKLDPEEERMNEERRRAMERIGGSL